MAETAGGGARTERPAPPVTEEKAMKCKIIASGAAGVLLTTTVLLIARSTGWLERAQAKLDRDCPGCPGFLKSR